MALGAGPDSVVAGDGGGARLGGHHDALDPAVGHRPSDQPAARAGGRGVHQPPRQGRRSGDRAPVHRTGPAAVCVPGPAERRLGRGTDRPDRPGGPNPQAHQTAAGHPRRAAPVQGPGRPAPDLRLPRLQRCPRTPLWGDPLGEGRGGALRRRAGRRVRGGLPSSAGAAPGRRGVPRTAGPLGSRAAKARSQVTSSTTS